MTTLDTKTGNNNQTPNPESAPAPSVEQSTDTAALITEQQVLFSSAALAPAPARHRNVAVELASAVRAIFTRPEKSHAPKHYPQRFAYLEAAALSREMDRL